MAYNIILTGTKSFDNYRLFERKCNKHIAAFLQDSDSDEITILTGNDGFAEKMAQRYASENGFNLTVYQFNEDNDVFERNSRLVADADAAICFWNGRSTGVKTTIALCNKYDVDCKIIKVKTTK